MKKLTKQHILSEAFYRLGHITSIIMMWRGFGWLYSVYNFFMSLSIKLDNGVVWKKVAKGNKPHKKLLTELKQNYKQQLTEVL